MPRKEEAQELLDFAILVAREAGTIAMKYFRTNNEVMDKAEEDFYDPVTRADREIESHIRTRIREVYPGHTIIGEEEGTSPGDQDYTWFIDPIDGTRGFLAGSPVWGILIGVVKENRCLAGLMHQPFIGETCAGTEAGAFLLNSKGKTRLYSSKTGSITDAIMCNTHTGMFRDPDDMEIFRDLRDTCRFSRFGTDCYGYSLLAMGFVDFVLEAGLKSYDIIPLIPIVEAAGGVVSNWQGDPVGDGGHVLASANPVLHRELLDRIAAIRH